MEPYCKLSKPFGHCCVSSKIITLLCGAAFSSVLRSWYHVQKFGLALFPFKLSGIPRA